ncbi:MAG: adenosylcobinamide-GDP ribazoletransferase [Halorientalis sp.]
MTGEDGRPGTGAGDDARGHPAALRGALGFFTRLPVGTDAGAWAAFRTHQWPLVPVGYVAGLLVAAPVVGATALGLPAVTVAVLLPVALLAVTGINHADGLADVGDAAAVHGGFAARRGALKDSSLGVGGTLALAVLVVGLALAGLALAGLPPRVAVALVVASEVGAKLAVATLAALGTAPWDGLGASVTRPAGAPDLAVALALALPAVGLAWPSLAAGAAVATGPAAALLVLRWARPTVGGVNGDVLGAASAIARLVALHAGVTAWTLS